MKILLISSEFPPGPGGIGRHAFSLTKELRRNHLLTILSNQDWAEESEKTKFISDELEGIDFLRFVGRSIPGYRIWRVGQALRLAYKLNPNQIVLTGKYSLWVGWVLKKIGIKATYIGFVHGSEVGQLQGDSLTRKSLNMLDRIIPVSNFTKSLIDPFIEIKSKIKILPNGVDDDFLKESKLKVEQLPWKGNPRLLTVGNLTQRKGQHLVIKALSVIKEQFPDLHYHMVGLPTKQEALAQLAEDLKVDNHITFHGRLTEKSDLMKAYASSEIFIMLSENQPNGDVEGFGIAILEANTFGIPAIGARGCGIEDAITSDSGILVDGNNPKEVAEAIKKIINAYELYGKGAIAWAEKHNWNNLIKEISD